ncbi:MAG: SIR2 family protein [Caldilineaceae bacterium]|nr:SIR2 family protein [Caldilineaceae bacterium]
MRPRLIVLASCQSAGLGSSDLTAHDEGALAALGPQLAEAGVPAVLAMQGNISMETVRQFMPVFFTELRRDGQIDRALAAARSRVRERPDWWMPVLYMRLKSGRIWYVPGFGDDRQGLKQWPALLNAIQRKKCTPILGPGIGDNLLGSRREIASRWAETYAFPLEPHQREDLPQVAQFVDVIQQRFQLESELENHLRREVWQKFGAALTPAMEAAPLQELLSAAGALYRSQSEPTIYQLLAQLDLPIYITTSPDNLLFDALAAQGKKPIYEFCRWNTEGEQLPLLYDEGHDDPPSAQRPLIYHLFGHLSAPETLVLTEDNYFDYLIGVTSNNDLIPSEVRRALSDTGLLFLGFRLDDWDFRVLFRSIVQREGGNRRSRYPHIAAQINPEEERILEPAGARQYLEARFQHTHVSIFWGSVEDFQSELLERLH